MRRGLIKYILIPMMMRRGLIHFHYQPFRSRVGCWISPPLRLACVILPEMDFSSLLVENLLFPRRFDCVILPHVEIFFNFGSEIASKELFFFKFMAGWTFIDLWPPF